MCRACLVFGLLCSGCAHATWSIVATDRTTGEVGLAAATCGPGVNFIAEIVPGAGVVAAQAATSFKGRNAARDWMDEGLAADEILRRLSDSAFYDGWFDTQFPDLQYGVATLAGESRAGFVDGEALVPWSGGRTGEDYSVQGNTLRGADVVAAAATAFVNSVDGTCRLPLAERLLRALEAGRDAGGDRRCPAERPAQSAILLVAGTVDSDRATEIVRIVTPAEIGFLKGLYYSVFPYEPESTSKEPVLQLRERYETVDGGRCPNN